MLGLSKNRFYFIFFFLLVLTPLVSAQSPFEPTTTGDINIQFNKFDTIKQNEDHTFYFHTSNATDLLDNSTVTCDFDLFYQDGTELIDTDVIDFANKNEFNIFVLGSNFSTLGEYSALTECNSSTQAGSISFEFIVTANGDRYKQFPNEFFIILLALISIFGSYFSERLNLFRYLGSITLMTVGVLTLYPGYNFMNHSTILGTLFGSVLISLGFYFLIEDSFSRDREPKTYKRGVR